MTVITAFKALVPLYETAEFLLLTLEIYLLFGTQKLFVRTSDLN